MDEQINLQGLNGKEVYEALYDKNLDTKKNVLEYIDKLRVLKKVEEIDYDQMQSVYDFVYESIDKMHESIKPNTIMYLKNELKKQIGKYVFNKEPGKVNHFIEFFKEAYPPNERRKDFTWVLMDINKISDEQILTTLKCINFYMLKGAHLKEDEKKDILREVKRLVRRKNLHNINDVRSLKALNDELGIKIVSKNNEFIIKEK
ncbi:MAG: hypothetical protein K5986_04450 [Clostridium sp.]|uniref:hypothetical protein n=1 Tax=Clostridium sp. DSM 8431 TaxID=1761781 RepID=UPI0008EE1D55|nr:hypothetical protein [Clostridium sp. DSM 8431]MCR4943701.1 hypothetical protein [Clostridium sp.]SFU72553.1 hypothetical protein SAMN04487886_11205 [Clostridium sp. DSM 8431]